MMASRDNIKRSFSASKEDFCRLCRLLHDRHLVSGVGGNVSARSGSHILLTPSGCSLGHVERHMISVVNDEGLLIEGRKATKEAHMHMGILRERLDVNVVLHLHGPYIIAASTMLNPGPSALPAITPGFVHLAHPLPMLPFLVPGTEALAKAVAMELSDDGKSAVLLQNHGLITVGKGFEDALNIAEEIDEAAKVFVLTGGRACPITARDAVKIKSLI